MAESPGLTQEAKYSIHSEKKCEREFRKLLEGTELKIDGNKNKSEEVLPERGKKRLKSDEETTSDKQSTSCDTKDQNDTKEGTVSNTPTQNSSKPNINPNNANINVETFFETLEQISMEKKCQSILNLAMHCSNSISEPALWHIINSLPKLTGSLESGGFAIVHALLLFTLTTKNLKLDQIIQLEHAITTLASSVLRSELGNKLLLRLSLLKGCHYLKAYKLCQKLLVEKNSDIDAFDVLSLCCTSLRNLTICKVGLNYKYSDRTLQFILGMTGKATQEIVSENLIEADDSCAVVSASSHMVNQCLKILEHMLVLDPNSPCKTLDHEDFSLLHCLTRLLGWSISHIFQRDQSDDQLVNIPKPSSSSFHISTLISILKILSVLSFNPDQYDSFTNIRGLMEKVMICILKTYFQSQKNCFDILVLALELMINFFMKNKKTFVLLCLKKFQLNDNEQILSIEALLKILDNSLNKINELKAKPLTVSPENQTDDSNRTSVEDNVNLVLEAADEDMELSTIVSFISILLVFFMDTKTSFVDFIRERLPLEKSSEAITVSKKFLQFASLTGGMPVTGILILRHAIKKLSRLYQRNGTTIPDA